MKLAFEVTVHMFASVYPYVHTHFCMSVCVGSSTCTRAPLCVPVHVHTSVHMPVYANACAFVCGHVLCVCTFKFVCKMFSAHR